MADNSHAALTDQLKDDLHRVTREEGSERQ